MYVFEARYLNMENGEERTKTIEIYEGMTDMLEGEIYVDAMSRAYGMKKPEECLSEVEFLAC